MASTTANSTMESISNTVADAASYVSNKATELTAGASKEGNKEIAKGNTNASLGDRASAGMNAIGDKFDETSAKSKAEADKTSAKN